ncbi:MAG TPA: endonuclease/exonuclease/phosphatase family protein [Longimicrobiales bacterium]|nr:endonuclease/exonuclease/phosphatase family protein [Longimicrobiales bacterium]
MATLVFLFLAEAQRVFLAVLFGLSHDAVYPAFRGDLVLLAVLLLVLALGPPLLPLARWVRRPVAAGAAVVAVAVFRLPLNLPHLEARAIASALVIAGAATFLVWAVTYLGRRTLAVGLVAGLVADQYLRLAGTTWDVSLRPEWFPVQAALSLALLLLAVAWVRELETGEAAGTRRDGLERRAAGIRLRGALVLGILLFLDLHVLALPSVAGRWAEVPYDTAAMTHVAAAALAMGVVLARSGPMGGRRAALALALVVALGLAAGWHLAGLPGLLGLSAAHASALLLMARAVEPARGRRSRGVIPGGLLVLSGLAALYTAAHFHGFLPFLAGGFTPWLLAASAGVLGGLVALLPQLERGKLHRPARGGLVAVALLLVGLGIRAAALPSAGGEAEGPDEVGGSGGPGEMGGALPGAVPRIGDTLVVATYNIHYGFDARWRFDPGAVAAAIREADPDILVLQEAAAGLPATQAVDLPLWLGRALGVRSALLPVSDRLRGDALLASVALDAVGTRDLPGDGDPRRMTLVRTTLGGEPLTILGLHLDTDPRLGLVQLDSALASLPSGPAVVLGDLNAEGSSPAAGLLRRQGFSDAFQVGGHSPEATWPAAAPTRRVDWIWVRDVGVSAAVVVPSAASDHRPVAAELHAVEP